VLPKISIVIPTHNDEAVIEDAIKSAMAQDHPLKEIIVLDDASTDSTAEIAKAYDVRVVVNEENLGIGKNLAKGMDEARGKYVLYLCGDDYFFNSKVASDVCRIFDVNEKIGIIGRYYFFFMDGKPGAIGVHREKNVVLSSICPSGMAFRKDVVVGYNKIFCEMPLIVMQYLKRGYKWTMIEYDTVASRFKPGYNTGTKESYYTQSPLENLTELTGDKKWTDYPSFIMLKNRAPKILWREIKLTVKNDKRSLIRPMFYLYAVTALALPRFLLKRLTTFYRDRIGRLNAKIILRGNNE